MILNPIAAIRSATRIQTVMIVVGGLFGAGAGGIVTYHYTHQPPVVVLDTYEVDGAAVSGGQLDLVTTKIDNVPCFSTVARWLWRLDPTDPLPDRDPRKRREYHEITDAPHAPPTIGKLATYRLVVRLPNDIEAGDWHYQGQIIDTCQSPLGSGPRFGRDIPIHIAAEDRRQ